MRWREIGWVVLLAGLPLSPFLLGPVTGHKIDLWHSHGWWAWAGLTGLSWSSLASGWGRAIPNRPLACWMGWLGGWWLVSFLITIVQKGAYDLSLMLGVLHLATGLVMYHLVIQLRSDELHRIVPWVARTGVVLSVYGLLQYFGFEQFFTDIIHQAPNRRVLGTVGNPSHFAAYLSCVLPIAAMQVGWRWRVGTGLILLAICASRSLGGMVAGAVGLLWVLWRKSRTTAWITLAIIACLAVGQGIWDYIGLQHGDSTPVFSLSGRWSRWELLVKTFQHALITGIGPGGMLTLSQGITDPQHPLYHWRHAHNEYLQVLIEQGVIGLALVGWMLTDCWKKLWAMRRDPMVTCLSGILLSFVVNGLYNFPAHLWVMSSLGLLAYAGIYSCWGERTA